MFDVLGFEKASIEAVMASIKVIRPFLLEQQNIGKIQVKEDETLLTVADRQSEDAGFKILRQAFPDVPIIREESGLSQGGADWEIWYDPIDGTAPFVIGAPTSTVICAAYSPKDKCLLAVTIGEPAYIRLWTATLSHGCKFKSWENNWKKCSVWQGNLKNDTAVFLDLTRGFTRGKDKRQILTDKQAQKLTASLCKFRLQMYGSNALHQALVAHGREKVVGGITTAMGGPWDAAGALLVSEAGGSCQGFKIIYESQHLLLEKIFPLNPMAYDILIYANNQETFWFLEEKFCGSLLA